MISIVTPAYNAAPYLGETARSVFAQTFSDWEWLIVDDGSTDATRDVAAGFSDRRVRVIAAEHSGLPAAARNRGIAEARGEFIAFLDADDRWLPEKLALQMACFDAHADVGLIFSRYRYFFEEWQRVSRTIDPDLRGVPNPAMLYDRLIFANLVPLSTAVVRRALLERYGAFDEDPRQRGTEDYELWLRLAPHAPFAHVDRPLMLYRLHAGGVSHGAVDNAEGQIVAIEKAVARTGAPSGELEAYKLFWRGHAQLRDGVAHCGRRALWQSLRMHPRVGTAVWLAASFLGPKLNAALRRLAYRFV
ncbi:MAG TPA: glycosyltransferase [Thermoanaerobaculia bacterium]|nr:glycosyltransferase [Thermoanaerobaculia bacterium]